jgi:hypothetical protein
MAGYSDQIVRLWDIATAKMLLSLKGHEGFVTASHRDTGY